MRLANTYVGFDAKQRRQPASVDANHQIPLGRRKMQVEIGIVEI